MKTIYIIRHGETELNKQKIVQGSGVDAGLNDLGRKQARMFFEGYKESGFNVILTSALRRTHETVAPFVEMGIPWEQFPEINEFSWGVYEGKKSDEAMMREFRNVVSEWKRGNYDASLEGGESAADMEKRIQKFVNSLKKRDEQKILICTHGRAMRCLMCVLKGESLAKMEKYHHANTGLYIVKQKQDQFFFEKENDVRHLNPELSLKS
ncbi:MAG: histidine phosphatase family protein [Bacteroidetes bacterium]|nr:histidine phosphatase family protein [Bacteroidota bacterium]